MNCEWQNNAKMRDSPKTANPSIFSRRALIEPSNSVQKKIRCSPNVGKQRIYEIFMSEK